MKRKGADNGAAVGVGHGKKATFVFSSLNYSTAYISSEICGIIHIIYDIIVFFSDKREGPWSCPREGCASGKCT